MCRSLRASLLTLLHVVYAIVLLNSLKKKYFDLQETRETCFLVQVEDHYPYNFQYYFRVLYHRTIDTAKS